ncbi:MAG TPA: TonB-dependent receptor plug domain-containing protein [Thermoguttaceae bacterium]|nr:TonB-dependent receptor plug domain-containing protein [Thermoguttaceae bacterium]
MATPWIVRSLAIVAACALPLSGFSAITLALSPGDFYETGSDPVAPRLSAQDTDDAQGQVKSDEETAGTNVAEKKDDPPDKDDLDLLDLNLKDLSQVAVKSASAAMNAEVSTVSRTESTVGRSPAAVYVITNEMIRRSGARNLPEVLRLAPGVQVARVTTNTWAISIRGFNDRYANKVLVQIDGRAVYTPAFGGVLWDMQQILLEDVERIEVIRGPGATVWGANAVNGVINVVTKEAAGTQGLYAESGGGSEHRSFNALRAGGRQGDLHWRAYGIQADDAPGYTTLPGGAWDSLRYGQGGFRMDWTPTRQDTLTLQGDFYGGHSTLAWGAEPALLMRPKDMRTTNFLGRWTRELDDEADWSVQMYYDNWNFVAGDPAPEWENQNTFDLDSQYHVKLGSRHDVVCGFGYRNYETLLVDSQPALRAFVPPQDTFDIISYFVQDTIELHPDRLFLTAGVKLEHNDFTNFEYQPSIRLLTALNDRTAIWGAISRAVRVPSVADRDAVLYGGFIQGSRAVRSEDVIAYEAGIRRQPTEKLYWDLAVFFNRYDNLIGLYPLLPPPDVVSNVGFGDTYGYELVITYEVNPTWRLRGSHSFLVEDISYVPNAGPFVGAPGRNPRNQFFLTSGWDLSRTTTLDVIGRYVDNLASGIPHYFVMDVRLAWLPRENLEIAAVGQNLLDDHHPEFTDFGIATEVPSGVYGMVSWRY